MAWESCLGIIANGAAILTAAVAVFAYGRYEWRRWDKRDRLERHLKAEKAKGENQGQRSIKHLMAKLRMTENDILDAAFRSKRVTCRATTNSEDFVVDLLFEYTGEG